MTNEGERIIIGLESSLHMKAEVHPFELRQVDAFTHIIRKLEEISLRLDDLTKGD